MTPTKLLYLEDFNLLNAEAKVLDVGEENGKQVVILDQTVFYPQGGGQPYDQGVIHSPSGKFIVEEVRFVDGVVNPVVYRALQRPRAFLNQTPSFTRDNVSGYAQHKRKGVEESKVLDYYRVKHIGRFESGTFGEGETVTLEVDKPRRELLSRIHSAGHVLDMGVNELELNWVPGKGYHFPEGPYVEYTGELGDMDKEKLRADIENACNKFIGEGRETKLVFMEKEKMKEVCHFVPDYIPEGKPGRVVMYGDFGIPCGGTHVGNIRDIGHMTIRKVKAERSNIRVSYDVERSVS